MKKYRAVVFDFDDTIYDWKNLDRGLTHAEWMHQCMTGNVQYENAEKGRINPQICEVIKECLDAGVPVYVCTVVYTSYETKEKELFLIKNVDERLEGRVIGVRNPMLKVDFLEMLQMEYGGERKEYLLVDDWIDTVEQCLDAGFFAITPPNIFVA